MHGAYECLAAPLLRCSSLTLMAGATSCCRRWVRGMQAAGLARRDARAPLAQSLLILHALDVGPLRTLPTVGPSSRQPHSQ